MHDDEKRKVIHATICSPAAESLRAFCVSHGVTVTAFLDGLGHVLADLEHATMEQLSEQTPTLAASLKGARRIDAGRRSREPRRDDTLSSNGTEATEAAPPA